MTLTPKILVTGFTPFDGRKVNASWIAANSLDNVFHLQIPVIWGQPMKLLEAAIAEIQPNIVISMGEGHNGWFDIESIARNKRKHRLDNNRELPPGLIREEGPDQIAASIDTLKLHTKIISEHIPIRISQDAGAFICEETLYSLETLKEQNDCLHTVVFVHLPPFGSEVNYRGRTTDCDDALLQDFARLLFDAVVSLTGKTSAAKISR